MLHGKSGLSKKNSARRSKKLPLPASAGSSHKTWRKVGDRGAWNSGTGTPGTKVKKENFCPVCQVRAAVREASLGPEPARGGEAMPGVLPALPGGRAGAGLCAGRGGRAGGLNSINFF